MAFPVTATLRSRRSSSASVGPTGLRRRLAKSPKNRKRTSVESVHCKRLRSVSLLRSRPRQAQTGIECGPAGRGACRLAREGIDHPASNTHSVQVDVTLRGTSLLLVRRRCHRGRHRRSCQPIGRSFARRDRCHWRVSRGLHRSPRFALRRRHGDTDPLWHGRCEFGECQRLHWEWLVHRRLIHRSRHGAVALMHRCFPSSGRCHHKGRCSRRRRSRRCGRRRRCHCDRLRRCGL